MRLAIQPLQLPSAAASPAAVATTDLDNTIDYLWIKGSWAGRVGENLKKEMIKLGLDESTASWFAGRFTMRPPLANLYVLRGSHAFEQGPSNLSSMAVELGHSLRNTSHLRIED